MGEGFAILPNLPVFLLRNFHTFLEPLVEKINEIINDLRDNPISIRINQPPEHKKTIPIKHGVSPVRFGNWGDKGIWKRNDVRITLAIFWIMNNLIPIAINERKRLL